MAWLPPELVGLLRLDARMRHGFLSWAWRRPQPALPEGQVLTCLEQGSYRAAFVIVLLTSDSLELRVGARTRGSIPLYAVRSCERLSEAAASWCRRHGIERRATLLASPLDKPNTVLMLDQDCPGRLTHLGLEQTGLRAVFLYLDRPHALIDAL
jgi:hypothetical protein